jgi:hypothetical protein
VAQAPKVLWLAVILQPRPVKSPATMTKRALEVKDDPDYDALRAKHATNYIQSLDDGDLPEAFAEAVLSHDINAVNLVIKRGRQESARDGFLTTGEDNPSWLGYLFRFDHLKKQQERHIRLQELKMLEDNGFLFVAIGMLLRENYWAPAEDAVHGEDGNGRCSAEKAGLLRVRDFLSTLQNFKYLPRN